MLTHTSIPLYQTVQFFTWIKTGMLHVTVSNIFFAQFQCNYTMLKTTTNFSNDVNNFGCK